MELLKVFPSMVESVVMVIGFSNNLSVYYDEEIPE
jgi:hypothetical protein